MNLILILKGFIVGLGKIIPGVSGSLLAMSMGIYEDIITSITNFFSSPKKNIQFLLNFITGLFIAIIFFSRLIIFLLNNYYSYTMYLFLGLIVGTLIPFTKELKWNLKNLIIFIIFFTLTFMLSFLTSPSQFVFTGSIINYLYTSILGLIDAFSSIIPGISGTALFMLLGSYEYVLNILANPFSLPFIIYSLGLLIGIIIICYIMSYLFKKKKQETYIAISAFMFSSVGILLLSIKSSFSFSLFLIFLIGTIFGYIFDKS